MLLNDCFRQKYRTGWKALRGGWGNQKQQSVFTREAMAGQWSKSATCLYIAPRNPDREEA